MIPVPPSSAPALIEKAGQAGKAIKAGQRVFGAAKDSLGIGSDHENTPQWLRQKRSKAYWQDNPTDIYDAYRLNEESGIGNEDAILRRLRKAGLLDADGNVIAPEGYDPASFDPTQDSAYDASNQRRLRRALESENTRGSQYRQEFQLQRAELAKKKMDDFKKSTIDPLTKTVNERIQEMLANPAITPEEMADMRSEAVSQARSQEAQRLTRVGATLGLRGIDSGSIAGAALISKIGEDTDRQITEGLRRFGLDVAELERSSDMAENEAALNWGTKMAQLETALTSGNLDQVFQINSELSAMSEAIAARDEATSLQKDANRNNLYGSIIGGASNIAGGALSGNL